MCPVGTQSIWTIWKSSTRLADGREIVYFDEEPGLGRDQIADTRPLPPRMPGPQPPHGRPDWGIRRDRLAGEWVVIAAARQDRTFLPPADQCPLDPSAPGRLTEIPADNYDVVVFENRFPSLAEPLGRCEVVCFTPDHDASFAALSPRRVRTVLEAWVDRTQALGALPETRQVYCFENRGEEIGVTLHHPHGQIYAFPFVAPRLAQMVTQAREYAATSDGANLFDDMVAAELAAGSRVVTRNEHWVVFVPEAARWPYEVRIFPVVRVPDLPALDEAARDVVRAALPGRAEAVRRAVRPARAVHRRLAPGPGAGRGRARTVRRAPSGTVGPARREQAQVPRRDRIGHGRVDQRHRP